MGILLFGSEILFIIVFIFFLATFLVLERLENSWGIFISFAIFITGVHFFTNYPIIKLLFVWDTLLYLVYYIIVGILYSLLKTYTVGKQLTKEHENNILKYPNTYKSSDDPKKHFELKDHVYRWIIWWWVGLINMIIGELPKKIYNYVYKKFERLYLYIWGLS